MNLVDSCGWLEYFTEGMNSSFFAPLIEEPNTLLVPSICIYEVTKRLSRERGEKDATRALGAMSKGILVNMTPGLAISAAHISLENGLGMADSIILATARHFGATLWTQDSDFEGFKGVRYTPK